MNKNPAVFDKKSLFEILTTKKRAFLLDLLGEAYEEMTDVGRFRVFNDIYSANVHRKKGPGRLFKEIDTFYRDSLDGEYYAPFDINSKNFMYVPEETTLWCEKLADYLGKATRLADEGHSAIALACFDRLYHLHENMCEEIVFADELGDWMIQADHARAMPAYIACTLQCSSGEPALRRISILMSCDVLNFGKRKVVACAKRLADKEFRAELMKFVSNPPKDRSWYSHRVLLPLLS